MSCTLRRTASFLFVWLALGMAGCAAPAATVAPATVTGPDPKAPAVQDTATAATLTPVRLSLPYQPNVQFAPIYLAQDAGYYRDAGLDVTLEYGDEAEQVRLVAAGEREALIAGGDQVILARASGLPVKYVLTWYQRFPVVVFATRSDIAAPADLVGKKVGLPAPGGTSMLGWQVLLLANDIEPTSVNTEVIGFTQAEAVRLDRVDAAVGYATNEPLQLRAEGLPVHVIEVADTFNLVSNGLVVGDDLVQTRPDVVQGLVTGTLRGIAAALADPDAAFDAVLRRLPEAGDPAVKDTQRQVLDASARFWSGPTLGAIDTDAWAQSQDYMRRLGLIQTTSPLADLVDTRFASAASMELEP